MSCLSGGGFDQLNGNDLRTTFSEMRYKGVKTVAAICLRIRPNVKNAEKFGVSPSETSEEGVQVSGEVQAQLEAIAEPKPKKKVIPAAPEQSPAKPDFEPMARLWAEATEPQCTAWLKDDLLRQTAPKDGERPRPVFLARLTLPPFLRSGGRSRRPDDRAATGDLQTPGA